MKQGNNNSNPSTCSCVSLQLHLLSLPKSLFSDSRRAFVISIIAFIALGESFSLKNLPISEKMFVLLLLGIGLSIFLFDTSKLLIFRNIRIALCSFFHHYFIFFDLAKLEFIIHLLDSLVDGARCAVIVPQSTMVGKSKMDKLDKAYILEHHTLEGVITLNPQTFYGVGTNPVIAVFTAHQPHPERKYARFIDFKNDGFVVFPHLGLLPTTRADERRRLLIDCWRHNKPAPNSFMVQSTVEAYDEWLHSFYYFNETIPNEADFRKTIADYLAFEFYMIVHGREYLFKKEEI